jgi:hypothetical protein
MALHEVSVEVQEKIAAAVREYRAGILRASIRYHTARGDANEKARVAIREAGKKYAAERDAIEQIYHNAMDDIDQIVEAAEAEKWKAEAHRIADYVTDRLAALSRESA